MRRVRADCIPHGSKIMEKTLRGHWITVTEVKSRDVAPEGCSQHVHINGNLCYDRGALVMIA